MFCLGIKLRSPNVSARVANSARVVAADLEPPGDIKLKPSMVRGYSD